MLKKLMSNNFIIGFVITFNLLAFNLQKGKFNVYFNVFTPIMQNLFFMTSLFFLKPFSFHSRSKTNQTQGNRLRHKLTIS
jgi:hypothetical protein